MSSPSKSESPLNRGILKKDCLLFGFMHLTLPNEHQLYVCIKNSRLLDKMVVLVVTVNTNYDWACGRIGYRVITSF